MKRSTRAVVRDSARRTQRLQLIQHDVPTLAMPSPVESASTSSAPALSDQALETQISAAVKTQVADLVREQVQAHLKELREAHATVPGTVAAAPSLDASAISEQSPESIADQERTAPYEIEEEPPAHEDTPPHTHAAKKASDSVKSAVRAATDTAIRTAKREKAEAKHGTQGASPAGPAVRVVTRNKISGDAARSEAPALARKATPERQQSGLAARCLAHAGQHYRGATEEDVLEAWKAMRERFQLSPDNKIVARRALLKWLQRSKNVCASNVHWYGDFVAVRSCGVRVPSTHPASGTDGWFVLFDPNGDGFMREPLFTEAFETPSTRYAGAVPRMGRPAWISEERRAAAAARHGGADLRPFSPETADDLSAQDFSRGRAE